MVGDGDLDIGGVRSTYVEVVRLARDEAKSWLIAGMRLADGVPTCTGCNEYAPAC